MNGHGEDKEDRKMEKKETNLNMEKEAKEAEDLS